MLLQDRALSNKAGILDSESVQARILLRQGNYEKAESIYQQILIDTTEIYGEKDPKTFAIMSAYSIAVRKQNGAEGARYSRLALQGWESLRGRDHPHTMMGYSNFAAILEDEGNWAEAEQLFRQTLESRQRVLGLHHLDTLLSKGNLARILEKLENLSEAENLYRQILIEREDTFGPQDVCRPVYLNAFGLNLIRQGRYDEAERVFRQALGGRRERLEQLRQDTKGNPHHMSHSLNKQETYDGKQMLSKGGDKLLDKNDINIVVNLALCLEKQKKYEEAEKYRTRLLESAVSLRGLHSSEALSCKESLAHNLRRQGKCQTALQIMQDVVERLKEYHPENTTSIQRVEARCKAILEEVLGGEQDLAFDLHKQERYEEALPIIQEVTRRIKACCPDNKPLIESSEKTRNLVIGEILYGKKALALDLREQGKSDEALIILQDIVQCLTRWDPENTTAIREAVQKYEALLSVASHKDAARSKGCA
jgi:tetratricopeptide (TPR) repeat protein